jgi:sulfate adenylyltransferase subunit 1 (EFTu-like GTPase family)
MAEYIPILKPGQAQTLKASATITAGQVVAISGVNTVAAAGANAVNVVGVAAVSAVLNDDVTIYSGGVQNVLASGTVTAGDVVVAGAAGTVATLAAVTTPTAADVTNTRAILGVALTTGTDVLVRVRFDR